MAELFNLIVNNSGYLQVANGDTSERIGVGETFAMIRYNSDFDVLEVKSEGFHNRSRWLTIDKNNVEPVLQNQLQYYFDFSSPQIYAQTANGVDSYSLSFLGFNAGGGAAINGNPGVTTITNYESEVDGCWDFNGNGELATIAHNSLQNSNPITISAWVKPTALTNIPGNSLNIIGKDGNNGYRIRINGTAPQGGVGTVSFLDRGSTNAIVTPSGLITAGNWYFITVTGSTGGLKIYINDILRQSNTTAFGGNTSTQPFTVGAADSNNVFNESFYGKMGMLLLYSRELSAAEISLNYNSTRGRFGL